MFKFTPARSGPARCARISRVQGPGRDREKAGEGSLLATTASREYDNVLSRRWAEAVVHLLRAKRRIELECEWLLLVSPAVAAQRVFPAGWRRELW